MADALPFFGISPFVLGMTRETVRAAAGEPASIETTDDEERTLESWFYEGGSIELEFGEAPDARLESVTAWSAEVTLNGTSLIDAPVGELTRLAEAAGVPDLALADDFGDSGACWQSEAASLMVWVVKGKVVNFTLFPRFDDAGDEPVWPED